jgi:hypothetical protein
VNMAGVRGCARARDGSAPFKIPRPAGASAGLRDDATSMHPPNFVCVTRTKACSLPNASSRPEPLFRRREGSGAELTCSMRGQGVSVKSEHPPCTAVHSQRPVPPHARSPFDALAALTCSGQALGPLVQTRAFGMTQCIWLLRAVASAQSNAICRLKPAFFPNASSRPEPFRSECVIPSAAALQAERGISRGAARWQFAVCAR